METQGPANKPIYNVSPRCLSQDQARQMLLLALLRDELVLAHGKWGAQTQRSTIYLDTEIRQLPIPTGHGFGHLNISTNVTKLMSEARLLSLEDVSSAELAN